MKLIILNGPVGVGKSTTAKKLQASLPLSFFFNFDEFRRHIGQYHEYSAESRSLCLDLAYACADKVFAEGKDFIIDKIMYDRAEKGATKISLDRLREVAEKHGAEIHEIILWADKQTVLQRLEQRGYKPHGLLTPEKAEMFWEEIDKFKDTRKEATVVDTTKLSVDDVYEKVLNLIFSK